MYMYFPSSPPTGVSPTPSFATFVFGAFCTARILQGLQDALDTGMAWITESHDRGGSALLMASSQGYFPVVQLFVEL